MAGRPRSTHRALNALLFVLVAAAFGAPTATAGAPGAADPQPLEVNSYVKDFDASKAEAVENIETQRQGADIVGQLEQRLDEDYAGVWFDNEAGEFIVPVLPEASRAAVTDELADASLAGDYRTAPAQSSWAELEAAQDEVDAALADLISQSLVQTSLDPRTNTVVIRLARHVTSDQVGEIRTIVADLAVEVDLRRKDIDRFGVRTMACRTIKARACDAPLRGGTSMTPSLNPEGGYVMNGECTAGFKAIGNSDLKRYVLTAGHCTDKNFQWSGENSSGKQIPIGPVAESVFPGGDWGKLHATGSAWDTSPWPTEIVHWGGIGQEPIDAHLQITGEGSSYVGQYVCHSGTQSGTSCGFVTELDVTVVDEFSGQEVFHETEFYGDELCVIGGDSGGPVFAGSVAIGLMSAGEADGCDDAEFGYYMEITEATADMNVSIAPRQTQTYATVKQTLNGQPGYLTIGGNVYSGNLELDNLNVDVKLEKLEGGSWKPNQTIQVPLNDNYYQLTDYALGKGAWKAKTIFPEQGPYAKSESGSHEFTIKDGYQLVAKHSGKCMDVQSAGAANGAQLHQWDCGSPASFRHQVFTLVPVGGGYVNIVPRHSGRCLDVSNVSQSDGARVQQWDCLGTGQSNQLWKVIDAGGGYVKFQAKHSGKCMDVAAADQNNGAAINQWSCGSGSNQQWSFKSVESSPVPSSTFITIKEELNGQPGFASVYGNVTANGYAIPSVYMNINFLKETSPGKWDLIESVHPMLSNGSYSYDYFRPGPGNWKVKAVYPGAGPLDKSESGEHNFHIGTGYRFVFRHSDKCMTVSENSKSNGGAIIQWSCFSNNPEHGQVFTLHPIGGGYNKVIANSSGKCLDVVNGSSSDGAWIQQWDCPGGGYSHQQWRVVAIQNQNGWFALQAKHSNKCADVINASTANGVRVQQWHCFWNPQQQWKFESVG